MQKRRPRVPIALPLIALALLILGILATPYIKSNFTVEELGKNVLLNAIPFVLIFAAILLGYISLIVLMASYLGNNISARSFRIVESILIAGIVIGVVGMFQPWFFFAYTYGFILLLISILSFIAWSHIVPKSEKIQEEVGRMPGTRSDTGVIESGKGV